MKHKNIINLIIMILLFQTAIACSLNSGSEMIEKTPVVISSDVTQTRTSTPTTSPTATYPPGVIVVTVNPTFLPQKKEALDGGLEQNCAVLNIQEPDYTKLQGSFVLYDRANAIHYIQTMLSNNRMSLSDAYPYSITVSPNRKWIAYLRDTAPYQYEFHLIVQSVDGKTQKTFDPTTIGDVTGISGWLNNETIVLGLVSEEQAKTLLVINPFTGNQQKLLPNFPNIYDNGFWHWNSSGLTIYSPDFHYVVYPAAYGDTPPRYILWDIQNNQEVTAILAGDLIHVPQWAENGSLAVVTIDTSYYPFSANEFYGARSDGTVVQMTKLGDLFPNTTTKVRSWSWSPDSRHIAFWLDFYLHESFSEEKLLILDAQTGNIVDYCIQGDSVQIATDQLAYSPAPVWSPDGSSLLTENRYEIDESRLILLDLKSNVAYELAVDVSPLGWLTVGP